MKRRNVAAVLALSLAGALALRCGFLPHLPGISPASRAAGRGEVTLVIDPGHGGEDGGAVSVTGVPESRINLSIALKCEQVAGLYGLPTLMLRQEDVSLAPEQAQTLREKKRADLQRRVELTQQSPGAWLLSIHQNKYDDRSSHGAQVFYRPDPDSQTWAQCTQALLCSSLDPNNHRKVKQIPKEIYLMSHITCPAILVECGFLSNPDEEQRLLQEDYQRRLAVVLIGAFLTQKE